jgi:dTDP-4-dehydrorhamnose reductase
MRILVTGATGFLGREVAARLAQSHAVIPAGGSTAPAGGIRFDLRDPLALRRALAETEPEFVVHLAAYREPDFCEEQPAEARRLNVAPVEVLCEALPQSAGLLFVSTDYVFDGERPPYREDSPRRAVNLYGQGKIEAEDRVLGRPSSLVVRMPLLVGAGSTFEGSGFLFQIVRALRNPAPQEADAVLRRFPTWTRDVAEAIAFLVSRGETGVVHLSGEEGLTRHEMITQAAEVMGFAADHIAPSARVVPRRAVRPRDSQLAADRIRAMGFRRFTPFREVVRFFAATFPEETRRPDVNARRRDTGRERRRGRRPTG